MGEIVCVLRNEEPPGNLNNNACCLLRCFAKWSGFFRPFIRRGHALRPGGEPRRMKG